MTISSYRLEICAANIESVRAAVEGGADRIELCSALAEGGVTPSAGLIEEALKYSGQIGIHVLIRPRGGNFTYCTSEVNAMVSDIKFCRNAGVDGVVIGALTATTEIDTDVCRRLIDAAGDMSVTFHRAFDVCKNPYIALEQAIELGCHRILTSGGAPKAIDGVVELAQLVEKSHGRIIILAGSGVNPDNAIPLLDATGVSELHASASIAVPSGLYYRHADIGHLTDEYAGSVSSSDIIARLANIVHNFKFKP